METSLAAQVTLLEMISRVPMFDLFAHDKPTYSFLRKRLCTNKDTEERHVRLSRSKEEEVELALRVSKLDEEMR